MLRVCEESVAPQAVERLTQGPSASDVAARAPEPEGPLAKASSGAGSRVSLIVSRASPPLRSPLPPRCRDQPLAVSLFPKAPMVLFPHIPLLACQFALGNEDPKGCGVFSFPFMGAKLENRLARACERDTPVSRRRERRPEENQGYARARGREEERKKEKRRGLCRLCSACSESRQRLVTMIDGSRTRDTRPPHRRIHCDASPARTPTQAGAKGKGGRTGSILTVVVMATVFLCVRAEVMRRDKRL